MRWLVFLVLAGCHKLFDLEPVPTIAPGDGSTGDGKIDTDGNEKDANKNCPITPVVYDEDGDNVDDRCDACPTVPSNDVDDDGDGLPTACDPNLSTTGDQIVLGLTLAEQGDLSLFNAPTSAWSSSGSGTITVPESGTLFTMGTFTPTKVEIRFTGLIQSQAGTELSLQTAGSNCSLVGSDCTGIASGTTCLVFEGGKGDIAAAPSTVARMTLQYGIASKCEAESSSGPSVLSVGTTPLGTGAVGLTVSASAMITLQSFVIYGAK